MLRITDVRYTCRISLFIVRSNVLTMLLVVIPMGECIVDKITITYEMINVHRGKRECENLNILNVQHSSRRQRHLSGTYLCFHKKIAENRYTNVSFSFSHSPALSLFTLLHEKYIAICCSVIVISLLLLVILAMKAMEVIIFLAVSITRE